jgi:hypothetical protein
MEMRDVAHVPDGFHGHAKRLRNASARKAEMQRLRCADAARNRARHYANRHRTARWILPLLTGFILVGLIFERRPSPVFAFSAKRPGKDGDAMRRSPMLDPESGLCIDRQSDPEEAGGATDGDPEPRYLPPADFLATKKQVAQIVAFLIRNRNKLDTDPVRMKWAILDRASLPLAVFLREVEANGTWDDLEKEISGTLPGAPVYSISDMPKSPRHRKILRLLSDWERRGEDFLSGAVATDVTPDSKPSPDDDDEPDIGPRKP